MVFFILSDTHGINTLRDLIGILKTTVRSIDKSITTIIVIS